ncbi:MAG: hypothetical protein ACOYLE_02785 [Bacteroidales bacterium]
MDITVLLITIIVLIVIFFLMREVNCWYWKINKRIALMEEQNELLKVLVNINKINTPNETSIIIDETEIEELTAYKTNQGEVFIEQKDDNIKINNRVFNYYKRPWQNDILKLKNGTIITIESGKIIKID